VQTNSPELSLLKFLLLAYTITATSWSPPWILHLSFTMAFLGLYTFFTAWLFCSKMFSEELKVESQL